MESIGEKLKSKREELGYSIEQVARDTNIAKRYIRALEAEDFDSFPGEPYLVGFLRTYSEYVGLNPDEIIGLYKNFKIQEQPVPMEELIEKKSPKPIIFVIVIVVIVAGLVTAGILFLPDLLGSGAPSEEAVAREEQQEEENSAANSYEMEEEILERRFLEGDRIVITVEGENYPVTLSRIEETLLMQTPVEETSLQLGEEKRLDLNNDGSEDILVYLRDIESQGEQRSVVLRFDKFTQAHIASSAGEEETPENTNELMPEGSTESAESGEGEEVSSSEIGQTDINSRKQRVMTVTEAEEPQPLTVNMVFRGYCLLRYVADDRVREQRYFHKGETFRLEADRRVRLWISNAGSVKTRIAGEDVDFGRPGEVVTKLVKWVENEETGNYQLQVLPVY